MNANDRVLILAPHPDDDILGCSGIIQQAVALHVPVHVVFLTYGDGNELSFLFYRKHPVLEPKAVRKMGLVRHDEAIAAEGLLGLSPENLTFLGYPDVGTLDIWQAHWNHRPPVRSILTRVTAVPYQNAFRPGAPYRGEEVLRDLTTVMRDFRPTKIFVSHPADRHPDHAALYLFTRIVLWNLEREMTPEVYPYLIHYKHWPRPLTLQPAVSLDPPAQLTSEILWQEDRLTPDEIERKQRALQTHRTQYDSSAWFLQSFVRPNEPFGDFPVIDLRDDRTFVAAAPDPAGSAGTPEELADKERARVVGIEQRRMWVEDGKLVLSVRFSRPLPETAGLSVYGFGYRPDRPFGEMPKLRVNVDAGGCRVFDQDQIVAGATVEVDRQPTQVTVRIPMNVLGDPRRVLTSFRTRLGEVWLDWAPWRIIEVGATRDE